MSALAFHEKAGRCQQSLWFGKFISDVFLCPDSGYFFGWLWRAVKAERSEFILSLDGPPQPAVKGTLRAKEKHWVCSFPDLFLTCRAELKLSSPFHPHSL